KEKNARYVDSSLVHDLLLQKVIGPLEFPHMSGGSSYEEYVTLSVERGIVFCTKEGINQEPETKTSDVVTHEEKLSQTFLKYPGTLKVSDRFYTCEFETKEKKKLISRMPRVLCARTMSLDEYRQFILIGETPP